MGHETEVIQKGRMHTAYNEEINLLKSEPETKIQEKKAKMPGYKELVKKFQELEYPWNMINLFY